MIILQADPTLAATEAVKALEKGELKEGEKIGRAHV